LTNKTPKLQKPAPKNMQTKSLSQNSSEKNRGKNKTREKHKWENKYVIAKGGWKRGVAGGGRFAIPMRPLLMQFVSVVRVGRVLDAFRARLARDFACINLQNKREGWGDSRPGPAIRNCRLAHSLNLPTFPVCT